MKELIRKLRNEIKECEKYIDKNSESEVAKSYFEGGKSALNYAIELIQVLDCRL